LNEKIENTSSAVTKTQMNFVINTKYSKKPLFCQEYPTRFQRAFGVTSGLAH
jgi:hypothetical protein